MSALSDQVETSEHEVEHNVEQEIQSLPEDSSETPPLLNPLGASTTSSTSLTSQASNIAPANAIEGGREISDKILYVGGLHKSITEDMLVELFSVQGPVQSVKLLYDKNRQGFHYAFVHYADHTAADAALQTLNGRVLANSPIKINWAFQSQQTRSTESSYNLFVGDLSSEINDEILTKAFSSFPSLTQAHVMWDMQTGRSRGYGFVSFSDHGDAERALATMNGEWIGGRAVRLNWASHREQQQQHSQQLQIPQQHQYQFQQHLQQQLQQQYQFQQQAQQQPGLGVSQVQLQQGLGNERYAQSAPISPQTYEIVLRQTPLWQTTVYLGNLAQFTTQNDLISLLQNFGYIVDFKFYPDRGCAFVKYDSHERAALAIVQLTGTNINGRLMKCGWGRDRPPPNMHYQAYGNMMYPQKQFN
ncbi:unnamed protein product [Kuraishia capsulata CBS 1993]|uniref:RRM domain-containing protein n=1 Tax=Kuraishia capsulata CBS 1993 TaxID=1382522 RepID=W6MH89_9ASCO|nr:uncharacterized protein KUCA_T00000960001 [Kuraishia capsulata CBS 1993]CDK24993.1 unnamed protein product [Kuraishia capsulata CBS 1993]